MLQYHNRFFSNIFRMMDVCIFLFSFVVAIYLKNGFMHVPLTGILSYLVESESFIVVYWVVWIYLAAEWKIYYSKRISSFSIEMLDVLKASMISFALAYLVFEIFRKENNFRNQLLAFEIINISCVLMLRAFLRRILRFVRSKGFNYRNILIVGKNKRSAAFAKRLMGEEEFGLKIIGYIDDIYLHSDNIQLHPTIKHLGGFNELHTMLNKHIVDEVFVFLPIKSFYTKTEEIIGMCAERGIVARIAADLFSFNQSKKVFNRSDDLELLTVVSGLDNPYKLFIKRCIDISVSLFSIILLSPLFLIVCLLIRLDSPGPVFFVQERVGCNNRRFKLIKFRTMVADADRQKSELEHLNEMDGPVFKMKNDPRITPIGRHLRIWSIDEFPQLLNVLKGDMSLVGPRPPLATEVEQYSWMQRRRLSVKPGITGLWQIKGRNTIAFDEWMKLDLNYIDNWTLSLDLQILIKTVWVVLSRRGAM